MKTGKSEIIVILDRSGSMSSIKNDMEGGFNNYLKEQQKRDGECFVSLYQFDDKYESLYENKNIQEVKPFVLEPRNNTALLDAIGATIDKVGQRLSETPEEERPETVIVLTVTDGEENASRSFTKDKIAEKVKHQTEKYNWNFLFFGTNFDAIKAGSAMGYSSSNSLSFASDSVSISNTWNLASSGSCLMREANSISGCFRGFSEADRSYSVGTNL